MLKQKMVTIKFNLFPSNRKLEVSKLQNTIPIICINNKNINCNSFFQIQTFIATFEEINWRLNSSINKIFLLYWIKNLLKKKYGKKMRFYEKISNQIQLCIYYFSLALFHLFSRCINIYGVLTSNYLNHNDSFFLEPSSNI